MSSLCLWQLLIPLPPRHTVILTSLANLLLAILLPKCRILRRYPILVMAPKLSLFGVKAISKNFNKQSLSTAPILTSSQRLWTRVEIKSKGSLKLYPKRTAASVFQTNNQNDFIFVYTHSHPFNVKTLNPLVIGMKIIFCKKSDILFHLDI